jgi:predicted RNase H-like HicB family nuclease
MKPYIVIVHKDAHSAYGMSFPDAPGCFSAADEIDELFAMAGEALELWGEGMREEETPIPEPRDFEALRADAKWASELADADFVIAVEAPWAHRREAAE